MICTYTWFCTGIVTTDKNCSFNITNIYLGLFLFNKQALYIFNACGNKQALYIFNACGNKQALYIFNASLLLGNVERFQECSLNVILIFLRVLHILTSSTRLQYLQNCWTEKNGHLAFLLPPECVDIAFFNIIFFLQKLLWATLVSIMYRVLHNYGNTFYNSSR